MIHLNYTSFLKLVLNGLKNNIYNKKALNEFSALFLCLRVEHFPFPDLLSPHGII